MNTDQGPLTQGLAVRLVVERDSACGELDLGDEGRFFPTDAAIARWLEGSHGKARVVYE
jgi:DNA polymerase-3 subunit alpha